LPFSQIHGIKRRERGKFDIFFAKMSTLNSSNNISSDHHQSSSSSAAVKMIEEDILSNWTWSTIAYNYCIAGIDFELVITFI
jgi:hypothetical protein